MAEKRSSSRTLGTYLSRYFMAKLAGLSFGSARDVYKVFGYARRLDATAMKERVQRQDIVKSCLYKPAEAIWTNPPSLIGNEKLKKAWDAFVREQELWSVLLRSDKILGVEPYVALFLGLPGASEKAVSSSKKVHYMQPFGASVATVNNLEGDTLSPRFGRPLAYQLTTPNTGARTDITAHWSRVVHLTNELTDDNNISTPRIMAAYNLFDDILKVTGGSAETFWLTANRGMQVDVDKEMELDEDEANALSDELDEFQHQLRRYVRTRGVKISTLGSEVADPRGIFEVLIGLLAGTYEIPQRVLMGSEAGQLASEQDRANWAETVQKRRTAFAEPYVLRPLVTKLQQLGTLPDSIDYTFEWPDAFHMSPLERAQTMAQKARAVGNLSRQAQFGTPITSIEEAREIIGLSRKFQEDDTIPQAPAPKTPTPAPGTEKESEDTTTKKTESGQDGDGDIETKPTVVANVLKELGQSNNETLAGVVQTFATLIKDLPETAARLSGDRDALYVNLQNQFNEVAQKMVAAVEQISERPVNVAFKAEPTTLIVQSPTQEIHHHHEHNVNVEAAAPVVVPPSSVTVNAVPSINVEPATPAIVVEPSKVAVNNTVEVAPAEVKVQLPARETTTTVTTDGKGNVTGSHSIEKDAG